MTRINPVSLSPFLSPSPPPAQSLPLAEYLTSIILEGEQPFDASAQFDPLRYDHWAGEDYARDVIMDTYGKNNCVVYGAFENRSAGRSHVPRHSLYHQLRAAGAICQFSSGVEVPALFEPDPSKFAELEAQCLDSHHLHDFPWARRAQEEAENVLENVGLSFSSFSKLQVKGADAVALLRAATTNVIPTRDGRTKLTYAVTPKGRVAAEFTVCKVQDEDYYVVGSRDYAAHDAQWLVDCARRLGLENVEISNVSDDVTILHVAGPRSLELLEGVLGADRTGTHAVRDIPFLQMRPLEITVPEGPSFLGVHDLDDRNQDAGRRKIHAQCFRVSFTGCQGYEFHVSEADAPALHSLLWGHATSKTMGLAHFGGHALNALRIEKGFKIKADLDFAHYTEAGIEPFVRKKRTFPFLGRDTTVNGTEEGAKLLPGGSVVDGADHAGDSPGDKGRRASCMFHVDVATGYEWSVVSDSPILLRRADSNDGGSDRVVGVTTSSARGAATGDTIAMGYLEEEVRDLLASGEETAEAELYLMCFGQEFPATFLARPPVAVTAKAPATRDAAGAEPCAATAVAEA